MSEFQMDSEPNSVKVQSDEDARQEVIKLDGTVSINSHGK
jgi:hypothetical protein